MVKVTACAAKSDLKWAAILAQLGFAIASCADVPMAARPLPTSAFRHHRISFSPVRN